MPISRIETNSIAPSQTLTTPIIATTMGVGGATPSGSGSGITFPATQSNSNDPNTLDDYEDGTWTPNLGGTTTYTTQAGYYTKIGRVVTVTFEMQINVIGTGTTLEIKGLPFVGANGNGQSGAVGYYSGAANSFYSVTLRVDNGASSIFLATLTAAASTMNTGTAFFGNGARMLANVTYLTT